MLTLTMATATVISGCGCAGPTTSEATSDEAVQIETKIETVTEIATDAQGNTHIEETTEIVKVETNKSDSEMTSNEKSENSKSESSQADEKNNSSSSSNSSSSKTEEKTAKANSSSSSSKTNSSTSSNKTSSSSKNNSSSSSKTNTNKSNTSSSSTKSESSKVEETKHTHSWVDITKQVKVIDQEAYTYEEPVYEYKVRTICKVCGEDITENTTSHNKQHALNGENVSYTNQKIKVQTGTNTVEVPEQSHYETKTTGRKCSSCGEVEYY